MSHRDETPAVTTSEAPVPTPGPDAENPALIDAEHAFVIAMISSALFIGAVLVFIL